MLRILISACFAFQFLADCPLTCVAAELTNQQFGQKSDLPDGVSFLRRSTATFIGKSGRLETAVAGEPRFETRSDESGVTMRGYLSEGPATNVLLHSSYEASYKFWRTDGKLTLTRRKGESLHGTSALHLSGAGRLLHRPLKLPGFTVPDFRSHFLTAYVRRKDGRPLSLGDIRPFAATDPDGENVIKTNRRFVHAVANGPWYRIIGYLTPPNEGQVWHCGFEMEGELIVDAVQLERRPRGGTEAPTSFIPTTDRRASRQPDFLQLPANAMRWPASEGTVVVWARTGSPYHNGTAAILRQQFRVGDQSQEISVMHHGGGLDAFAAIGGSGTREPVATAHWTQVIITWKNGRGRVFVDGVENHKAGLDGFVARKEFGNPTTGLFVGVQPSNNSHFAGYVARVEAFDRSWDWKQAWKNYRDTFHAAGGDASKLKKPPPPKRVAKRPMIPKSLRTSFDVNLPRSAPTSIAVYNRRGELVRTLWEAKTAKAGKQRIEWDTGDDSGKRVIPGEYTFKLLQNPSVEARYVATPGNGRVPQREGEHEIAGVHGLGPRGVCVDGNGDLYLLGRGHGVGMQKYSPEGHLIWTHAPLDTGDEMTACAVDGDVVYVAGQHLYRINAKTGRTIRKRDGVWRAWLGEFKKLTASKTKQKDRATRPPELAGVHEAIIEGKLLGGTNVRGIAVRNDRVYVSCYFGNRIDVFDKAGLEKVSSIPIEKPSGIAFDSKGRLHAISNRRVVRLAASGSIDKIVVQADSGAPNPKSKYPKLSRPFALAVGLYDNILVTDMGDPCRMLIYSLDGKLLDHFGATGALDGRITTNKLYAPTGIAATSDGRFYLTEYLLNRLQSLKPDRSKPGGGWSVRWCLYGGAYMENTSLLSDDLTVAYGLDGYNLGALYEYKVDLDTGRWTPERWWWLGHSHPTREVFGFLIHGQQTHTIGGHRFLFTCHKTVRIYRIDGDSLTPVARVGGRFKYFDGDGKLKSPSGPYPIWIDRDGDGLAQANEVEYRPKGNWKTEPHIGFSHDAEVTRDGTVYWGNFALPLERIDKRGVPHYSWKSATVAGPDFAKLQNEIIEGVGADEQGNRYFDVFFKDDDLRQPGLGHWSRRVKECYIQKFAKDGRPLWKVGHKALGHPDPGGIHQPTCTDVAGDFVFVGDEVGMFHIWTRDGVYVSSHLTHIYHNNNRAKARARGYLLPMESTIGEFWSLDAVRDPKTGRYFVVAQSHEFGQHIRVYEIRGLDQLVRLKGMVTVR